MKERVNLFINKFLKSMVSLSITFLLLAIYFCFGDLIVPNGILALTKEQVLGFKIVPCFIILALLLNLPNLLKRNFGRTMLRIGLAVQTFSFLVFYLIYKGHLNLLEYIKNSSVVIETSECIVDCLLYLLFWFVALVNAYKRPKYNSVNDEYGSALRFFKRFSIFILVAILVTFSVVYFVDYKGNATDAKRLIERMPNVFLALMCYLISQIAQIKRLRDLLYSDVKPLEKASTNIYLAWASGVSIISIIFLVFKKSLDTLFASLINSIGKFFGNVKTSYQNVSDYLEKIKQLIDARPPRENDGSSLSFNFNDLIKDFGIDENPDGNFGDSGDIGDSGSGDFGGEGGGLGGFIGSGFISGSLSESGRIGLSELSNKIQIGNGNYSVIAFVNASDDCYLYLKLKCYGDYSGKGWKDAPIYVESMDNSYSMSYLIGSAISCMGVESTTLEIMSLSGQYFLPDYISMDINHYDIQKGDSFCYGTAGKRNPYSVGFYSYNKTVVYSTVPTKYYFHEKDYESYVRENYLSLPDKTRDQALRFLTEKGIKIEQKDKVDQVLRLFENYYYDIKYDRNLDNQNDIAISFLTEYKTGICQHFASSGVVLFRAMGIPSRYVGGLYVGDLKGNQVTAITSNAAHAWVEIYQSGSGWVRVDPTAYAQVISALPGGSYSASEYDQIMNGGGSGGNSGSGSENGGSQGGSGDNSGGGNSQGGSSDNSSNDSSGNSSNNSSGTSSNNSSESSNKDSSVSGNESSKTEENSSSSGALIPFENCNAENLPWNTVCIVGGALLASVFVAVLIKKLTKRKKKKVSLNDNLEELNEVALTEEEILIEEEHREAVQIIRDNYKEFIKIAGKHGIRKYPFDTTESLRVKYSRALGPSEAMEILTKLYRIARYNKNERLTMEDANQSTKCLEIIKEAFDNSLKK